MRGVPGFGPRLPTRKTAAASPPALRRSVHSRSFSPCIRMIWVMTGGRSTWTPCCGSVPSAGPERCPHRSRDRSP